jgi:hypothetical protein
VVRRVLQIEIDPGNCARRRCHANGSRKGCSRG